MKRYLKKYGLITLFVCLVLVITGLAVLENYTDSEILWFRWEKQDRVFEENTALPYIKWTYDGWVGNWVDSCNLTSTAVVDGAGAQAEFLIESWEEYQAYMALVTEKKRDAAEAARAAPYDSGKRLISGELNTYGREIDEEFFRENKLAVLDFCFEGCSYLRSRLKEVRTDDGVVEISLEVQLSIAATTEQTGQIYWIPVSASCTSVESTFQRVHWNRS